MLAEEQSGRVSRRATSRYGLVARSDEIGISLYAVRAFASGKIVLAFQSVSVRTDRERHTVEHPSGSHLCDPDLAKVAHGCDPNCTIDVRARRLTARRAIKAGERITFDYQETETRIRFPFSCTCGAPTCRGRIE